ncbi:STE20/SPS1-related proline-alanine-rich protein kinase [Acropora cervicornis]|uniref:STE20/SPS1-related proline-alanine-rich protein kinase n=1 Tax=Acropora cervicornis TaxID=6130 RepID=A0AAD9QJW6_ACRCE|nr:STE20/SPS1-related proline-alanine-rich protein kinase [Acropora cervicornis]
MGVQVQPPTPTSPKATSSEVNLDLTLRLRYARRSGTRALAANLRKVIDNPPSSKSMMFPLKSGGGSKEAADDKTLIGFAQLTINS